MSAVEIKKRLINKIKLTDNQNLLEEIYRLLALEYDDLELLALSEKQKAAILKGQSDIKKGKIITNDKADAEIDKWIKNGYVF